VTGLNKNNDYKQVYIAKIAIGSHLKGGFYCK